MIDTNELTGFLNSLTNVDYLRVIRDHIDARIAILSEAQPQRTSAPAKDTPAQPGQTMAKHPGGGSGAK